MSKIRVAGLARLAAAFVFWTTSLSAAAFGPSITAAQLREDAVHLQDLITRLHPDPRFSSDPQAVEAALGRILQDLPAELSRDEAWRRLARLNPLLADGHFFVGHADWRAETRAWLATGGALFPCEIDIRADGTLWMRAGTPSEAPTRIVAINGNDASALVPAMLALVHGDTPAFRTQLLAERWWFYHWKLAGAPERYRLTVEQGGVQKTIDLPGSRAVPRRLRDENDFGRQFALAIEPGGVAVLTIGSFSWHDPSAFLDFTRNAFQRIRDAGVASLVIDISANGGGDDAMWLDGLMPYLATRPYRTGSTTRKKGMDGEIGTWRQPKPDHPLRFGGKVSVRIGPGTYSSAILFANVMKDFKFGSLTGTGGMARRSQSGGTRRHVLPHSGLALWLPRFIIDPPAGRSPGALLEASGAH
ncbi:S41 family peptidase [Massilia sp. DD77]|uniref:S41 family peptidase n=1 Tax=Massilia sp. DD77 TaxID=3109349 RepID=UPI002FFDE3D6